MKIIHFCKGYPPDTVGGMETAVKELACSTSNLGLDVEVICPTRNLRDRIEIISGIKIYFCRTYLRLAGMPVSSAMFFHMRRLIERGDILHYHFPYPLLDIVHLSTSSKQPSIVTYHSDIVRQKRLLHVYKPIMHRFLRSMDKIVVTSPEYRVTSEVLSRYTENTQVIPIGLDKSRYPTATPGKVRYWRNRIGHKFFLFVGVLRPYKGLMVFLEAVKTSKCSVVLAGAGVLEKHLRDAVSDEQISNIELVGQVSDEDKAALLSLCHGVILPSTLRSEAFGISLLEGAMFGKPLISCDLGTGTSYINKDKITGIVVPPGDPYALGSAMEFLWDHPAEAAAMGARGALRYEAEFTAKTMANSYMKLYTEIIDSSH